MKHAQENKGITLIALVITIIVMLILVAVVVSVSLGDNGLFNRAKEAAQKTNAVAASEAAMGNEFGSFIDSLVGEYPNNGNDLDEGTKNLFDKNQSLIPAIRTETPVSTWGMPVLDNTRLINMLMPATTYTISYDIECVAVPENVTNFSGTFGLTIHSGISGYNAITLNRVQYLSAGEKAHIVRTFTTPSNFSDTEANYRMLLYTNRYIDDNNVGHTSTMIFSNIQIIENIADTNT